MEPTLDAAIALVALAPLLAAPLAPVAQRFVGSYSGWILAIVPASIFMFLCRFIGPVAANGFVASSIQWVPSYNLALSFFIDGLSLTFALTISGIGTLVILFAGPYLAGHPHQGRFYSFLLAFMGAMLGLVLADSLLALFTFWELTAITSFLLIGFDHARQSARRGAIQALVVSNIGGLALLVAALLIEGLSGSWNISALRGLGEAMRQDALYPVVLILVLLAAFTKSAQFPFQLWLPNAMEAPTPVSAFLHSAAMVQAGVYLLARLTPLLGGTPAWTLTLTGFGGFTLLWGAVSALRQTDLKQMLAHSTVASLGLLVLLVGIGSKASISALVVYFVAHALYKAAMFMLVGTIDHATGTRDITALGGLMRAMPLTFAAALLAAISMVGLPLTLGYLGKEEMYLALAQRDWLDISALLAVVCGNALLGGLGLVIATRPFLGPIKSTAIAPHEGSFGLVAGPLVLGAVGVGLALAIPWFGAAILAPAASTILNQSVSSHLTLVPDFGGLVPMLSVATWALSALIFFQFNRIQSQLRRLADNRFSVDSAFDALMFGLIRLAGTTTRFFHHGNLQRYLLLVFIALAVTMIVPVLVTGGYGPLHLVLDWRTQLRLMNAHPYEWLVVGIAAVGLLGVLITRNRLAAILTLGIQGTATALIFLLFSAPDLAFTQLMIEVLSVVILTLVMTRLNLDVADRRPIWIVARDGLAALACGSATALLLLVVVSGKLDLRLGDFFAANSAAMAHGRNIVNVILVDFRGLDTLGEIAVILGAGIAISALLRRTNQP